MLFTAVALLPLAAMAQKPFTINGNIKGLKTGDKVYLVYSSDENNITDSATVANGVFSFKGSLTDPAQGGLFLNKNPYVQRPAPGERLDALSLYIEPGNLKLTATDSLKNSVITGSLVNDDAKKLKALTQPVNDQLAAINADFLKLTEEQKKDPKVREEVGAKYDKIAGGLKPIFMDFAKNHPKSFISLAAVGQLTSDPDQMEQAEKVFDGLSAEVKATKQGKSLAQYFGALKKTGVGVMAMDFTQNDVNDKPVKLSDFRGKYVLVDFWASWCGPCRQENPNVVAAYNKFKDKGFTILGVSLDDAKRGGKAAWLKAIEDDKLAWTQVSDLKFWKNEVAVMYGIHSIPANFLIDPTGKIIARDLREEALQEKLDELLNKKSK